VAFEKKDVDDFTNALDVRNKDFFRLFGLDGTLFAIPDCDVVSPPPPPLPPPYPPNAAPAPPCRSNQGGSCSTMACCAPLVCYPTSSLGLPQPQCDYPSPPPPPPGQAAAVTAINLEDEHQNAVSVEHVCTPFETALFYADAINNANGYKMLVAHDSTGGGGNSTCDGDYVSDTWVNPDTNALEAYIMGAKMPNTDLPVAGPGVTATFGHFMHSVFSAGTPSPYLKVWVPKLGRYCGAGFIINKAGFEATYAYVWNEWPVFSADGELHVPTCTPAPPCNFYKGTDRVGGTSAEGGGEFCAAGDELLEESHCRAFDSWLRYGDGLVALGWGGQTMASTMAVNNNPNPYQQQGCNVLYPDNGKVRVWFNRHPNVPAITYFHSVYAACGNYENCSPPSPPP
jgi:hypothetical protein